MSELKPSIYVACLGAYNNGYLHGKWLDAAQDVDALYAEIKNILASSPILDAEEFAIHDYEGFGGIPIDEYTSIDTVSSLAGFVAEHGELGAAVLAHAGGDIDEARRLLDDCYHGGVDSEEDFAISFAEDTMTIPDYLGYYIDYEKMARDLFISNYFSIEINHKTYVFSHQ